MVDFRGLGEDLPLQKWLQEYIWPAEKKLEAKFVFENSKKAIREMQENGIQVFSDMYFFEEEVARAARKPKFTQ